MSEKFMAWAADEWVCVITNEELNLELLEGPHKGMVHAPSGRVLFADSNGFALKASGGGEYFFPWPSVAAIEKDNGQSEWLARKPMTE